MKYVYPFLFLTFFAANSLFGQHKAVSFDYEKAAFNNNQPLPAETHILLQGKAPQEVNYVEIAVYNDKGSEKRLPLYVAAWKRPFDKLTTEFNLPINYKLRGSTEYDFKISFFRPITAQEQKALQSQLYQHLDAYLEQTFGLSKSSIQLNRSNHQVITDLNKIVKTGLKHYRSATNIQFEGFSDIIKQTLRRIEKAKLSKGKFLFLGKTKDEARAEYRKKLIADLKTLIHGELDQILQTNLAKLSDSRYINDYETEKTDRQLSIQLGYGGTYVDGDFSNLSIGNSAFIGLAFPLGKRAFAPRILSNTAITVGAYVNNFKDLGQNGNDLSGPIFKRPVYLGLSHKLYQFIYLNAGATFLEEANTAGQISGLGSRVYVRPNFGISVQINLTAKLER